MKTEPSYPPAHARFPSTARSSSNNFPGQLLLPGFLILLTCLRMSAGAQTGQWMWTGGTSKPSCSDLYCGQAGVYGTIRNPDAGNLPGSRYGSATWTDKKGALWLFGGYGFDQDGGYGFLNDLWRLDPASNEWAWMGGNSAGQNSHQGSYFPFVGYPGSYGTLGVPAPDNIPGSRSGGASWVDSDGNLWLFAGEGYDSKGTQALLNDLWMLNPSTTQWTWMGGGSTIPCKQVTNYPKCQAPGVYGSRGVAARSNLPGSRRDAATWVDRVGNFWLMGGPGADAIGTLGTLNDLWEFQPPTKTWTWWSGSKTVPISSNESGENPGEYGTRGQPAAGNVPGSRYSAGTWTDADGHLWLFGGGLYDSEGELNFLNDLWEFNPTTAQWTWMNGSSALNQLGVYGTLGIVAVQTARAAGTLLPHGPTKRAKCGSSAGWDTAPWAAIGT